jgi:hypothetical protein
MRTRRTVAASSFVTSYDSLGDLIAILDSEVRLLLDQDDVRLLIGLPRFLDLMDSEPRLASALAVLRDAVRSRELEFRRHDETLKEEIRALWKRDERLFVGAEEAAQSQGEGERFHALGRSPSFASAIDEPAEAAFPADDEIGRDPSRSGGLLKLLNHWHHWIQDPQDKDRVGSVLERLRGRHDHEYRRLWLDVRNRAGIAFARLESHVLSLNPPPSEDPVRWAQAEHVKELVEAVFDPDGSPPGEQPDVKRAVESIKRDVRLLHQALRTTPAPPLAPGLIKRFRRAASVSTRRELGALKRRQTTRGGADVPVCGFLSGSGPRPPVRARRTSRLRSTPSASASEIRESSGSPRQGAGPSRSPDGRGASGHLPSRWCPPRRPEVVLDGRRLFSVVIDLGTDAGSTSEHHRS